MYPEQLKKHKLWSIFVFAFASLSHSLARFDLSIPEWNMSYNTRVEGTLNKQIFNMSLENDYEVNEKKFLVQAPAPWEISHKGRSSWLQHVLK